MLTLLLVSHRPLNSDQKTLRIHTPAIRPTGAARRLVQTLPYFPGCTGASDKAKCAEGLLKDYLYRQAEYPATPNNTGTAGLAVIGVQITAKGEMKNIRILRDPGHGRGLNALRIVQKMQNEDILWEPATINGSPVTFDIYLKIRYSNFCWSR